MATTEEKKPPKKKADPRPTEKATARKAGGVVKDAKGKTKKARAQLTADKWGADRDDDAREAEPEAETTGQETTP